MKMIFRELYLFSPGEKEAKKVDFEEGINVITSDQQEGTDRGKSVIMRSLYHSLGADAHFENKWDVRSKVFILHFEIDDEDYYIYRAADLFKVFNGGRKLLFTAANRHLFMEEFREMTHFAVELPDRQNNELTLTPPVFTYLPFFLDQDYYDGSQYRSFCNLGQFQDFKDGVIFCHLGIYNEEYFTLTRQKEKAKRDIDAYKNHLNVALAMRTDIENKLGIGSCAANIDILKKDVEQYHAEYEHVYFKLSKVRQKLITLRNDIFEAQNLLREMMALTSSNEKDLEKLRVHICPECGSRIIDTVKLRSKRYNLSEDIVIVKNDLQTNIQILAAEIEKEEQTYASLLEELHAYDAKVKQQSAEIDDVLRYRGLCELKDSVINDIDSLQQAINDSNANLKKAIAQIRQYAAKKKAANERYYELLTSARSLFGLSEINPDKFKSIKTNFTASGSNKNIATVIWYVSILKLRMEFNPDAIVFPAVFDSPNNVETDDVKKHALIKYIFENTACPQVIVSCIGFDATEFPGTNTNLITLTNDKYHLLDKDSYVRYQSILTEFCDAEV